MSDDIIHFKHDLSLGQSVCSAVSMALHAALTDAPMDIHAMERAEPGLISRELPAMLGRALAEAAKASDREGFVSFLAAFVCEPREDERVALLIERAFADPLFLASFVYPDPNAVDSWV